MKHRPLTSPPCFLGVPGADYDGVRAATPAVTAQKGSGYVVVLDRFGYAVAIVPAAGHVSEEQLDVRGVDQREMYGRKKAVLAATGTYPGIGTELEPLGVSDT